MGEGVRVWVSHGGLTNHFLCLCFSSNGLESKVTECSGK